jgi:catalase-peroxidase
LIEKAAQLRLSVPEMTALVGGLRALNANTGAGGTRRLHRPSRAPSATTSSSTCSICRPSGRKSSQGEGVYEGLDRQTGKVKWTATPVDLVFGSNAELRAVAEVYASADGQEKFVQDFVRAWNKVMNNDRFDLR